MKPATWSSYVKLVFQEPCCAQSFSFFQPKHVTDIPFRHQGTMSSNRNDHNMGPLKLQASMNRPSQSTCIGAWHFRGMLLLWHADVGACSCNTWHLGGCSIYGGLLPLGWNNVCMFRQWSWKVKGLKELRKLNSLKAEQFLQLNIKLNVWRRWKGIEINI